MNILSSDTDTDNRDLTTNRMQKRMKWSTISLIKSSQTEIISLFSTYSVLTSKKTNGNMASLNKDIHGHVRWNQKQIWKQGQKCTYYTMCNDQFPHSHFDVGTQLR